MSADFAGRAAVLAGHAGILFGWRPGDFWTATPAELAGLVVAAAGAGAAAAPLPSGDLAALIERFPDE